MHLASGCILSAFPSFTASRRSRRMSIFCIYAWKYAAIVWKDCGLWWNVNACEGDHRPRPCSVKVDLCVTLMVMWSFLGCWRGFRPLCRTHCTSATTDRKWPSKYLCPWSFFSWWCAGLSSSVVDHSHLNVKCSWWHKWGKNQNVELMRTLMKQGRFVDTLRWSPRLSSVFWYIWKKSKHPWMPIALSEVNV